MPRTCQEWRAAPRFRRCGLFLYCSGGRRERDCAHHSHPRCEAAAARNHCRSWCGRWGRYGRCTAFYPEYGDDNSGSDSRRAVLGSTKKNPGDSDRFGRDFPGRCVSVRSAACGRCGGFCVLCALPPESGTYSLSGTADRREAPEGLSRILPGTLCRINLKIHRFISSPEGL